MPVALTLALAAMCGCDQSNATPPAAQTPTTAPRLAVLSPALAQTLRDLGAEGTIVARHGWDSFTSPGIPPVGNEGGIDYEALLKSKPTHIILQSGAKENPARLEALAAQNHWHILRVPALTLDDISAGIAPLAQAAGVTDQAREAAAGVFRDAFELVGGLKARAGRVLVLAGVDPPTVMGPGSFHYEMVERLGADAVPNDGAAFIQWSVEDVIRCDPDTLVLMLPGADGTVQAVAAALGPLARPGLRCVTSGRVVVISDPKCHLPATSLARVAERLRESLAAFEPIPTAPTLDEAAR